MGEIRFTSEFFIVVLMYTQSFCRDNGLDIFKSGIYNQLLLNNLQVISQKYGRNL